MIGRVAQTAIVMAAVLAFLWQTVLLQTHFHPHVQIAVSTGVVSADRPAISDGHPGQDQPADCPICQELAHASAYLLPGSSVFGMPDALAIWVAPAPPVLSVPIRRSHAWRSRAPPLALHA